MEEGVVECEGLGGEREEVWGRCREVCGGR